MMSFDDRILPLGRCTFFRASLGFEEVGLRLFERFDFFFFAIIWFQPLVKEGHSIGKFVQNSMVCFSSDRKHAAPSFAFGLFSTDLWGETRPAIGTSLRFVTHRAVQPLFYGVNATDDWLQSGCERR